MHADCPGCCLCPFQLSPSFSSLCLLDLCGEGCFIVNETLFRNKLRSDIAALQLPACSTSDCARAAAVQDAESANVTVVAAAFNPPNAASDATAAPTSADPSPPVPRQIYSGPSFVNVHAALRSPVLCAGPVRDRYRSQLLCVCQEIQRQLEQNSEAGEPPRCIQLPSSESAVTDSSTSVSAALATLSLTTVCGYLLDYPVLYCTHDPNAEDGSVATSSASASSPSSSSSVSNNLGGCALVRCVLEAEPATAAAGAGAADRTLVGSFTVPHALRHEAEIDLALQRWSEQRLSLSAATHRWRLPLLLSHTAVELTSVSL